MDGGRGGGNTASAVKPKRNLQWSFYKVKISTELFKENTTVEFKSVKIIPQFLLQGDLQFMQFLERCRIERCYIEICCIERCYIERCCIEKCYIAIIENHYHKEYMRDYSIWYIMH